MSQTKKDSAKLRRKKKSSSRNRKDHSTDPAVLVVLKHLEEQDTWAKANEDLEGPSIIVYMGIRPRYYIHILPDMLAGDVVTIPEESLEYLKLGLPIEFWIVSDNLEEAVVVPDYILDSGGVTEFKYCIHKEL